MAKEKTEKRSVTLVTTKSVQKLTCPYTKMNYEYHEDPERFLLYLDILY